MQESDFISDKLKEVIDNLEIYTIGRLNTAQVKITVFELQEHINRLKEIRKAIKGLDKCGIYEDGWIPCNKSMPPEHDSIFAKFKGTKHWNSSMFEKISDEVNVTIINEKGDGYTTHAHTIDGKWSCDILKRNKFYRVVAWQPLPKLYIPPTE